jgi:hypothetical protein
MAGIGRRLALSKAKGLFSKRTEELANLLVETDPQKNAIVIDDLINRMQGATERQRADYSKAIARMAAQQLGLGVGQE